MPEGEIGVNMEVLAARLYLADGAAQGTPFVAADQAVRRRYFAMAQAAADHYRRFVSPHIPPGLPGAER